MRTLRRPLSGLSAAHRRFSHRYAIQAILHNKGIMALLKLQKKKMFSGFLIKL